MVKVLNDNNIYGKNKYLITLRERKHKRKKTFEGLRIVATVESDSVEGSTSSSNEITEEVMGNIDVFCTCVKLGVV